MARVLDVAVPDVTTSLRFYEAVFEVTASADEGGTRLLTLRSGFALRLVPDATNDDPLGGTYRRGDSIRLELRVSDVDAWLAAFIDAGATVRCRLAADPSDGVLREAKAGELAVYAQVIDPFGHRWALAAL